MGVLSAAWRRLLPRETPLPAELRRAVSGRDWPTVQGYLEAVTGRERELLLSVLAQSPKVRELISGVVADDETPSVALLLSGVCHLQLAHEAGGGHCGRCAPSPEQGPDLNELGVAEQQLVAVAEREPEWPEARFARYVVATVRGVELAESRPLFDEVVRLAPGHVGAHHTYLDQLIPRHGGTEEEMHAFAYGAMTHTPGASPLGVLVPVAHMESLTAEGVHGCGYLRNPLIARQLHDAADRSVRHPDYRRGPDWVWEHNVFAMMFSLTGERAAARDMFRALGGRLTVAPWHRFQGNPRRAHRRARHRSGVWF
ncbi:hypothetical protein [Streptomyces hainanensis]|uniref:Tetratricopeptide repeat protein n=1 Tax=Streptomyces hainanensis TaxID=402648 RepID=A0A4R4TQD6_9ACTN|nr:hypothetical protein [Streptomyces hainanensis]TDC76319.1 hypothetical protein E1283_10010 [Streptomyces hainanensis]